MKGSVMTFAFLSLGYGVYLQDFMMIFLSVACLWIWSQLD